MSLPAVPALRCRHSERSCPSLAHIDSLRLRRRPLALPGLLLLLATLAPLASGPTLAQEPSFVDIVRRSGFIFAGTVKSAGDAKAAAGGPPAGAAVHVDRVLEALPPLGNFTGREVNVRLLNPQQAHSGDRAIFFTYVQSAGTTLGLVEVASEPAGQEQAVAARIREARQALADQALSARLQSAERVVVGVLGEARPTEAARERDSEHDPLWWRAPIRVASVEKGAKSRDGVTVNIAYGDDVIWRSAPKPKAGQEGIFLLQPDREKRFRTTGLFLIDPLDFLSKRELERVRRLLKAAGY